MDITINRRSRSNNNNGNAQKRKPNQQPKGQRPKKMRRLNNNQKQWKSKQSDAPVARSNLSITHEPKLQSNGRSCRIAHKEFIATISPKGDDNFSLFDRYRINPASTKTFPWLSTQAVAWENYKFIMLKFVYEAHASSTTAGSVTMSPDYDAADGVSPVQYDEQIIMSNIGTRSDSVWKTFSITLPSQRLNRLFKAHVNMSDTRFLATNQDVKTVDAAQLMLFTQAGLGNVLGKLFVEYIVEFRDPQGVTEEVNQGGSRIEKINGLQPNSTRPITSNSNRPVLAESNPIIKDFGSLDGLTLPTATIGQFLQDWQGVLNVKATGTGFTDVPELFLGKNINGASNDPLNVQLTDYITSAFKGPIAGGTAAYTAVKVAARAGDFLKFNAPDSTTITDLITQFSAASSAVIL